MRLARLRRELLRIELSVRRATTEIAAGNLPDQIAAVLAMIATDRAFARIVREIAELSALVERADGVCGQSTEAHCRNVEYRTGVRLFAMFTADQHAEIGVFDLHRPQRVVDPFVAGQIDVLAASEWLPALHILGALIDQRALSARERHRFVIALE